MADPTVWGQLTGYTPDGLDLYHELKGVLCLPGPEFVGAAAVGYTAPGLDLLAWAWECCDGICPDSEVDCYVEELCYTGGVSPGISKRLAFRLIDFHTCHTARNKGGLLEYDAVNGWWYGEVELRGGTLELTFTCNAGADGDPGKFTLQWSGCDTGSEDAGATCFDPLIVAFNQLPMPGCCDCPVSGSPLTEETARISIVITGNCRNTILGQLVGYTSAGLELYGKVEPCDYRQPTHTDDCGDMLCGVMAEIDTAGDCACLNGLYPLDYLIASSQWVNDGPGFGCPGGAQSIAASCNDLGNGFLRITVGVVCGITASGTGFADIPADELEDLDVTVNVSIDNSTDPAECCAGVVPVRVYRP